MSSIAITVDTILRTAYIRLSDERIARTVEYNDSILVDVDEFNVAVGIEVLDEGTPLPFEELVSVFHVHTSVVDLLRLIRPDVASYLKLSAGNDGSSRRLDAQRPVPA